MDCTQQIPLSLIYLGLQQQAINRQNRVLFYRHSGLFVRNYIYRLISGLENVRHEAVHHYQKCRKPWHKCTRKINPEMAKSALS